MDDVEGRKTLLTGPARTGKSAFLRTRLGHLLTGGAPGNQITVVTINRAVARRIRSHVDSFALPAGATPRIDTYFGIAGATVARHWSQVRDLITSSRRRLYPVPLANELAQFHLRLIVESMVRERGYFRGLRIRPERIVAQLLETAHSAALNGRSLPKSIERLKTTWNGQSIRLEHFEQAEATLEQRRHLCAESGLIDVSLLVEYFRYILKTDTTVLAGLREGARYLLADNLEEHPHVAQEFLADLSDHADETLFVSDEQAGFRQFLGAHPAGVEQIIPHVDQRITRTTAPTVDRAIAGALLGRTVPVPSTVASNKMFDARLCRATLEMIEFVVERANTILNGPAGREQRMCVVAPYVDGLSALLLEHGLEKHDIRLHVRQPSAVLIDRPCVRAFRSVAATLHPRWASPARYDDLRLALMLFLNLDPVTSSLLLAKSGFESNGCLDRITDSRVAEEVGEESMAQYNSFLTWARTYRTGDELPVDLFVRKLFGEVIARAWGPNDTPSDVVGDFNLLQNAARRFVELGPDLFSGGSPAVGAGFLEMLSMRVTPARVDEDPTIAPGAVYFMPVHTFLTGDLTCDYQIWLDAGSQTWWNPPSRPLTNSHVLLPDWPLNRVWDTRAKGSAQTAALARVVQGLAARAREGVTIVGCEEGGNVVGPMWKAVTKVIEPHFRDAPIA